MLFSNLGIQSPVASQDAIGNRRLVLWPSKRYQLTGISLPARKRYTIQVPASIHILSEVQLTTKRLYILDDINNQLWSARLPPSLTG